jgi:hypothetical protein
MMKMLWVMAVMVGIGSAAACASSSANTGSRDGGVEDGTIAKGDTGRDVAFVPLDAAGEQDAAEDAGSDAADDGGDGGAGCFTVKGSGASQTCTFVTVPDGGTTCTGDAGGTFGSCPSKDLAGCCLVYDGTADAAMSQYTATCYYPKSVAGQQAENCDLIQYEGTAAVWDPASP